MSSWLAATPAHGLVPAAPLHAFLRAGSAVYETADEADALRASLRASGTDPWSYSPAQAAALLCSWNATVLQTLGETLAGGDQFTAVPMLDPVTFQQAWNLLDQVSWWLSSAQRALADPGFNLTDTPLPAGLPAWVDGPTPRSHLRSLREATDAVAARAEVAVAAFVASAPPSRSDDVAHVSGLVAATRTASDYAHAMSGPDATEAVQREVQGRLHDALGTWFAVGQLLAMPALAASYARAVTAPATAPSGTPSTPLDGDSRRPGLARGIAAFGEAALINAHARAQEDRDYGARDLAGPLHRLSAARTGMLELAMEGAAAAAIGDVPAVGPVAPPGFIPAAFNVWCLTEPSRQQALATNAQALHALNDLWRADPYPSETLVLVQQINVAVANGDLRAAVDASGAPLALSTCPWPAVYDVVRPTAVGGGLLRVGTQVAAQVGADATGVFRRRMVATS